MPYLTRKPENTANGTTLMAYTIGTLSVEDGRICS